MEQGVEAPTAVDVDLATLLTDLCLYIKRFVVLEDDQYIAVALWIAHTYVIDAFEQTPYLSIRSAEKQCGKSRLMEVLELLCARPRLWERPSEAVTFRAIQAEQPTLLLDEIDTIWDDRGNEHEGLRALLNAGNRRGVTVPRCVGNDQKLMEFPTFCAKALAGIGAPPSTVGDRSIPIILKRRTRDEPVERFRKRVAKVREPAEELRDRLGAWAATDESKQSLSQAWPDLPEELSDRAQDAVEPLLAIADLAEHEWGERSRDALVNVITGAPSDVDSSLRLRLLADTRTAFQSVGWPERIRSPELCSALAAVEDSPWADLNGKSISPNKLGFLLKHYGIKPRQLRFPGIDTTSKGYRLDDFRDAWNRYLPAPEAAE